MHFLYTDTNSLVELDKLIKMRNYYRRKYRRIGLSRYKIFRNTLNIIHLIL